MDAKKIKRIAINTGGGDAPGLNAVIRAVVLAALKRGWECVGIVDGYNGIFHPNHYEQGLIPLDRDSVSGITQQGGTILGTTNKGDPLEYPVKQEDGSIKTVDRTGELAEKIKEAGIDAVIAIGGDGSMRIANALYQKGVNMIGVPKTIDNDLEGTVVTFGFDSAVSFASECLDRLHSTAKSHQRVMVVEVMGRYAGWIALHAGISGDADVILIPEVPYDMEKIFSKVTTLGHRGKKYTLIVVAEGAYPKSEQSVNNVADDQANPKRQVGGVGKKVAKEIQEKLGKETRFVVLGHLLRGGSPTARDRILSLRFGAAAIRALEEGKEGVMVALDPPGVRCVPLCEVTQRMKLVPLDCDTMLTARDLDICFGD